MTPYYQTENGVLYHGDCLEIMPGLEPKSVTLLFADPPYGHKNHDGDWNARLNEHRGIESKPIANDSQEDMRTVVDGVLKIATTILREDCCCCCCCCGGGGPLPTFAWLASRMDNIGLTFFHSVIWDKKNPGLGWRFRRQHEMLMFSHIVGGRLSWNPEVKAMPNIISVYPPRERMHPNEKPIDLYTKVIFATTVAGDLVLDPFAGSCTTAVACEQLSRKWICIELEEKYCEIAAKRIERERQQLQMFPPVKSTPKPVQEEMF
jgi:DNA modification methylase